MSRKANILVWTAVVLFFAAYFFPLWSISLTAPQYPEGMGMYIWIDKVTGKGPHDLQNINGLNHYIGMREIHAESIPELRFMKYIVAALIAMGLAAGIGRRRWLLAAWVVVAIIVASAGLADFYKWEYDYGHNLDPDAPIKVPGMTYQPPLFGSKKLLNITASAYPAAGGWALMAAVGLAVVALLLELRRSRPLPPSARGRPAARDKVTVGAALLVVLTMGACTRGPAPIRIGEDACDYCRMTIVDAQYGAEIVTKKGRVYKFDAVECVAAYARTTDIPDGDVHGIYVVDFAKPGTFVPVDVAVFLHSENVRSPMGMNLAAFADRDTARPARAEYGGELLSWREARVLVDSARVGGER